NPLLLPLRLSKRPLANSSLFTATPTDYISTLSLHDALPIFILHQPFQPIHEEDNHSLAPSAPSYPSDWSAKPGKFRRISREKSRDRKSTRLNSSHVKISYAVLCLKKKKLTRDVHLTKDRISR